jgi:ATP-dependent exoDNAse (exonuclease V) beta subunit
VVKYAKFEPEDWEDWKAEEFARQVEEARRLLYVAFTRARDHVVTCGRRSEDPEKLSGGKQFLAPLEVALRHMIEGGDGERDASGLVEWMIPDLPPEKKVTPHRLPADLKEPSGRVIAEAVETREKVENQWKAAAYHALRSPVTRASDLTHRKDLLKSEEANMPDGDAHWFARLRGIRVHAAMELIALHGIDPGEACIGVSEPGDPPGLQEQICTYLESGATMLKDMEKEGWKPVVAEWPLLVGDICDELADVVPDWIEVLSGTADLILQNRDEQLMVVDYKTGASATEELIEIYGKQLTAYRCMLEKCTGKPVSAELWSLSTSKRLQLS